MRTPQPAISTRPFPRLRTRPCPAAFTLVELLVVVSIIAVLISVLLPSLRGARESAKKTVCQANLRSLGLGVSIYAYAYDNRLPSSNALWAAPWGTGDMFWHQRLIEEGVAEGKEGPKRNNAVCPSDKKPWTPYVWTAAEEFIYNSSYGANPVAFIIDRLKGAVVGMDGIHDWNFYPYQTRKNCRVDSIRYPAYLVLVTEVEGPQTPYYFDPWLPNTDTPAQDGEFAWARHDYRYNGKSGGYVNLLHADGTVTHSRLKQSVFGLSDTKEIEEARKLILPEGRQGPPVF